MPELVLAFPAGTLAEPPPSSHPKAVLVAEDGTFYRFRWAPVETERNGGEAAWVEVERPGLAPLLLRAGRTLRELTFAVLVADLDPAVDVEADLRALAGLARSGVRVRLELGPHGTDPDAPEWARLVALRRRSLRRQHGTNKITQAEVELTLREAPEAVGAAGGARVGPVGGGADFTGRIAAYRARYRDGRPRTYRVKAGDTLHSISLDFYGSPAFWRNLADANGVRDPRHLRPGRVLRIP